MWRFVVRRFFYSLLVICGVLFLTFVLFNLAAGDPAAVHRSDGCAAPGSRLSRAEGGAGRGGEA